MFCTSALLYIFKRRFDNGIQSLTRVDGRIEILVTFDDGDFISKSIYQIYIEILTAETNGPTATSSVVGSILFHLTCSIVFLHLKREQRALYIKPSGLRLYLGPQAIFLCFFAFHGSG